MNDQQTMLADMANALFGELSHAATVAKDWSRIEEMGFGGLLLGEDMGGFGGSWVDAGIVFRLAGYHALALPLAEAIMAAKLACDAGFAATGFGTIAEHSKGSLQDGHFTGTLSGVPFGKSAAFVVAPSPDGGALVLSTAGAEVEQHDNLAGEPRDVLTFRHAAANQVAADIYALGAAARVMQAAGAMDAALSIAVGHVNDRKQFGKPLGKLQAVQQALAVFACEAAATNTAAVAMAQALDRGEAGFEIAAAKNRANIAAGVATAIAHQVHGAIGFTIEYHLHPLTRRLWSWRSEFGNEQQWSTKLGRQVVDLGAEGYWAYMAGRADPVT
jgi:acyl-CoA dehydrogenase